MSKATSDKATLMLMSGELDKALVAFEVATGFAAMGMDVNMWFVLYGVNCIKKPTGIFSLKKWISRQKPSAGRVPETDVFLQRMVKIVNHDGAEHLPLSQLNYLGLGPRILNYILRKKGIPELRKLIDNAVELGVQFKICQICVDAFAIDIEQDLIVDAKVLGVSSYVMDAKAAHFNAVY
ncbi:MAG TPA: DsrE/DsrF/DrsH-like family protein [Gammaproteobacteria bacterium]